MNMDPHQNIVEAFNAYLSVAVILSEDLMHLLEFEIESESWRRNYIRTVSSLVEGTTHCLRELARIGEEVDPTAISGREKESLKSGLGLSASQRVELTFRATHTMFQLGIDPDQPQRWEDARMLLEKNDQLAHPKSVDDLAIPEHSWLTLEAGAKWLTELHFGIVGSIRRKYVAGS